MNERFGLNPLPPDSRDFSLGAAFPLPKLSELPKSFRLEPLSIKNQSYSDFCTAFATCGMSEIQEGVELCPEYSFALGKELSGKPEVWGQDMRVAMNSHVRGGAIEQSEAPFTIEYYSPDFLRRIENWPAELKEKARKHWKGSFLKVDGPYDDFDDIRAAIWRFRDEKRAVGIGLFWDWPADQKHITAPSASNQGHMLYATGWETADDDYLVCVQSWGKEAGDNGLVYINRRTINASVPVYGAFMFSDITKEEYLERIKPKIQLSLIEVMQNLVRYVTAYLKARPKVEPTPPVPVVQPEPVPDVAPVEPPKPPESMQEMVRRVCTEEALSPEMAKQLYLTVQCESNFNPKATNKNVDGTCDYGIAQFNSYWYIGATKPIPSVDVAMNDPEFCVRVMAKMFLKGRKRDWICARKLGYTDVVS